MNQPSTLVRPDRKKIAGDAEPLDQQDEVERQRLFGDAGEEGEGPAAADGRGDGSGRTIVAMFSSFRGFAAPARAPR